MLDFVIRKDILVKYTGNNKNVVIPDSVVTIKNGAFERNKSIVSVVIPDSVKVVGDSAFRGCESLEKVTFGNSVEIIEDYAFNNCVKLEKVILPDSLKTVGKNAFGRCVGIRELHLGNSLKIIDSCAFSSCHHLSSVIIPDSVTQMNNNCFCKCSYLTHIRLSESLTEIGESAFSDCPSIESIELPSSVIKVSMGAFSGCSSLKNVKLNDGLEELEDSSFYGCTSLESIVLPDSLKVISNGAFADCSKLKNINIADNIEEIGGHAFFGTPIDNYSDSDFFIYKSNLISVNPEIIHANIPDGVKKICSRAFENCRKLVSVAAPSSLREIDMLAFRNCCSLTTVLLPEYVTTHPIAFDGCFSIQWVTDYNGNPLDNFFFWADDREYTVDRLKKEMDVCFKSKENLRGTGSMWIEDDLLYSVDPELSEVVIPDGVKYIVSGAFMLSDKLTSVVMPDSVVEIDDYAFFRCVNLTSVKMSNSLEVIHEHAFDECYSLSDITLPDSLEYIFPYAFNNCCCINSLTIPENVIAVDTTAFVGSRYISCNTKNSVSPFKDDKNFVSCIFPDSVDKIVGEDLSADDLPLYIEAKKATQANIKSYGSVYVFPEFDIAKFVGLSVVEYTYSYLRGFILFPEKFTNKEIVGHYMTYIKENANVVLKCFVECNFIEGIEFLLNENIISKEYFRNYCANGETNPNIFCHFNDILL